MNLTKDIKSTLIGLFMGMSSADRKILNDELSQLPETQGIVIPQYSRNNFLRAIQLGQLSEQQLKWFYSHLDAMDRFHRNGGAMGATLLNEGYFKPRGDEESGYTEEYTFQNKMIEGGFNNKNIPSVTVLRDDNRYGLYQIEDYCTEIIIKKGTDNSLLAEFYCLNHKLNGNDLTEQVYEKLNESNYNLLNFVQIKAFNAIRSTATRNAIDHSYKVKSFYKIKEIGKEFVVKFIVEELK